MKLKNILKKMTKIIVMMLIVLTTVVSVSAASAPGSLTITYKTLKSEPISFPGNFHVKYTSNKDYVYCLTYAKTSPSNIKYTRGNAISDAGINYILEKGANNKTDKEYFITQTALWIYMQDKGLDKSSNNMKTLKNTINNSSNSTAKAIKNLVSEAKKASKSESGVTLSVNTKKLTFKLSDDKKYYESNVIKVTSNGDYTIKMNSNDASVAKASKDGGFYFKVPADDVKKLSINVDVTITAKKTIYYTYEYNSSNSKYQKMSYVYSTDKTKNVSLTGSINKTQVTISKVDASTSKELPGAKLKLNCNNGAYVQEWTSTDTPRVFNDVPEGTCTLTETIAPEGYVKTDESIVFKVVAGKATAKQIMKNAPEKKAIPAVTISKIDVTTGSELPGATLKLSCNNGQYEKVFQSGNEPTTFTDVPEGKCTLTETIAPEGYVKTDEVIEFEVVAGKALATQVMKNAPEEKKTFEVKINKVVFGAKEMLEGADLQVTDTNGNVLCDWTTDGNTYICSNLPAGTYTLTEVNAPDGYDISEPITFTIDENGVVRVNNETVDAVTMVDKPTPVEIPDVPNTLSSKGAITYIAGLFVILVGVGLVAKSVKKQNEK